MKKWNNILVLALMISIFATACGGGDDAGNANTIDEDPFANLSENPPVEGLVGLWDISSTIEESTCNDAVAGSVITSTTIDVTTEACNGVVSSDAVIEDAVIGFVDNIQCQAADDQVVVVLNSSKVINDSCSVIYETVFSGALSETSIAGTTETTLVETIGCESEAIESCSFSGTLAGNPTAIDPVDPIDPIDPTDPVDPTDPTDPTDPDPALADLDNDGLCDQAEHCDGNAIDPDPSTANSWYYVDAATGNHTVEYADHIEYFNSAFFHIYIDGGSSADGINVAGVVGNEDRSFVATFCPTNTGHLFGICIAE